MNERILKLVEQVRLAESEGRSWELAEIAGRKVLRIRLSDGVASSFLDDDEVQELDRALHQGPPTLEVAGLPPCTWETSTGMFACKVGAVDVSLEAALGSADRDPAALATAAATCGRILDRLPALTHSVAVRLLDIAQTWGAPTRAEALAARLTLASIRLSGDAAYANEATLYFHDGGVFAGHHVEAHVDESGAITHAALIG